MESSTSKNFNLEIDLLVKHAYSCGENIVEEYNSGTRWVGKYESLSRDIIDRALSIIDFPNSIVRVIWDQTERLLENKDDLIQQILEFASTLQNITAQDDDTVCWRMVLVKQVSVSPQEFELTKARIVANQYEYIAQVLWEKVYEEIQGLGHGASSLYEELQSLEGYVDRIVGETTSWEIYYDENYEREMMQFLIERARREFRSLPAVTSRTQFLERVHLSENDDCTDDCSICMGRYLPDSEVYSMPCSHRFHFGCIETWLLRKPSCPMCRYKLPSSSS